MVVCSKSSSFGGKKQQNTTNANKYKSDSYSGNVVNVVKVVVSIYAYEEKEYMCSTTYIYIFPYRKSTTFTTFTTKRL